MTLDIMLQGTASNVGKSILATALCKIFKEEGYQVAPFKSWNMALNSYVTISGGEVGIAQALQAKAAGVEITTAMQPILVKPKGEGQSQVIVRGQSKGDFSYQRKEDPAYIDWAMEIITDALGELQSKYEVLVLEGAGSPAEINIKEQDLANMRVAKINQTPVLLVADIDRGGALASIVGTLKLLEAEEKKLVKGIILNKFRGDYQLLKPAISLLEEKTGKAVLGVVPYLKDFNLPEEDSVSVDKKLADIKEGFSQKEELEKNLNILTEVVKESLDIDYLLEIIKN